MNNLNKLPGMDLVSETNQGSFYVDTVSNPNPGFYVMEIWKDISGYEGYYQVSSYGRIRGLDRMVYNPSNKCDSFQRGAIRVLDTLDKNYAQISLSKDGVTKKFLVHRLVAIAFVPNPNNYPIINHINCDKSDNKPSNLEWCTQLYNNRHARINGRFDNMPKGVDVHNAILTEDAVRHIRRKELRNIEYCKLYNVAPPTITMIQKDYGRWAHIQVDESEIKPPDPEPLTKICPLCNKEFLRLDFPYQFINGKFRLRAYCWECGRIKNREYKMNKKIKQQCN